MKTKKTKKPFKNRMLKNFLAHPAPIFVLLCTGVLLVALTIQALAISIGVGARLPAAPVTEPAVLEILAPVSSVSSAPANKIAASSAIDKNNPVVVSTKELIISGQCPKASHIIFYRNDILAGVAQCIGDPTFSITIELQEGLNVIKAQVYNITEDAGPMSVPIYISYVNSTSLAKKVPPLILTSDYKALGFLLGKPASWQLNITGGQTPYKLDVDWGDGSQSQYSDPAEGAYSISHTYQKESGGVGFDINISATDANGDSALLQLMSVIAKPGSLTAQKVYQANQVLNPNLIQKIQDKLWIVWPVYIVLVLMAFSFWLGEREELFVLRHRKI